MRGTILGATGSTIGGVVLSHVTEAASNLVWSVAGSTQVDEGDPGSYTVGYTGAALAPGMTATISVATATGGLTWPDATAGSDYTALSTVLTFTGGGVTEKTVAVSTIDDTEVEGTEDFRVTIGSASVGTLGTSEANTTIVSEDSDDLLLDLVAGAVQAYSMRKLRAAYAGDCLRLRRSSDNVEEDFGFDGAGDLDTAAIATWLGGATGHVVTWYDQSGNGFDVTQAAAANQPEYISSGIGSLPSIDFVRANADKLAGAGFTAVTDLTIAAVVKADTEANIKTIASSATGRSFNENNGAGPRVTIACGTALALSTAVSPTVDHLVMALNASGNGETFQNGTSLGSGACGTTAMAFISIGEEVGGFNQWDGLIAETIVWGDDLTVGERGTAEDDMMIYWDL